MWSKTIINFEAICGWSPLLNYVASSSGVQLLHRRFGWAVHYALKSKLGDTHWWIGNWMVLKSISIWGITSWKLGCVKPWAILKSNLSIAMHLRVHNGKRLWTRHACCIAKPICSMNDVWVLSNFAMTVGTHEILPVLLFQWLESNWFQLQFYSTMLANVVW